MGLSERELIMGLSTKHDWFYLSLGRRCGPVSKSELQALIENKEIYIESTKVWREGMEEWVELLHAKDFASYVKKLKAEARKADARVRQEAQTDELDEAILCRGATRGLFNVFFYVGWLLPMLVVVAIITELQVFQFLPVKVVNAHAWIGVLPLVASSIALWQVSASRMKHAGYSRMHGLTIFVPIWNIWTLLVCLCAPRNFGRKKKVDNVAVISFLVLFFFAAVFLLGLVPGVKARDLSPFAVTEKVFELYEEQTQSRARYNEKVQHSASIESRREQMKQQKAAEEKARQKAMMDKRGL